MGKGDKRKKDPKKKEEKKKKQEAKGNKKAIKGRGGGKNDGATKELQEEDIEAILAEIRAKDQAKTAVTITECSQPSPRANFSLTTLPSGELLLFGGEYYDGEDTIVYNGVFRWHLERGEWKQIESINTPPPRCSHQAVCYRDHLYVFGGEFGTSDQFYHYRDFWRLDLKTNRWEELPVQKETPSARSGHRMTVWRNYLILFGGFYEAFRETKWFNDVYLLNFQDMKWKRIEIPPTAPVPAPRSGCQMAVSLAGDAILIHGGYSKVKVAAVAKGIGGSSNNKAEGYVHEDMWALQLKNIPSGGQPFWERVSRKGTPPSARSGASMVAYKTIALSFGGVWDVEGKQHAMSSVFFSDLYQFDMMRKRWYAVGLRQKGPGQGEGGGKRRKGAGGKGKGQNGRSSPNDEEEEDEEEDPDGQRGEGGGQQQEEDVGFAYIDAEGNVVYLNDEDCWTAEEKEEAEQQKRLENGEKGEGEGKGAVDDGRGAIAAEKKGEGEGDTGRYKFEEKTRPVRAGPGDRTSNGAAGRPAWAGSCAKGLSAEPAPTTAVKKEVKVVDGLGLALVEDGGARIGPLPRINPALTMRGHMLYVYGGHFEEGDREYCLDDAWCLDLNRREEWRCLLPGTMHLQVWKGDSDTEVDDEDDEDSDDEEDEQEASDSSTSSSEENEEGGSGEEEENADEEKNESIRTPRSEGEKEEKKEKKKEKKKKKEEEEEKAKKKKKKIKSVKEEVAELQESLSIDDPNRTPQLGEKLRDFYARTTEYWTSLAVAEIDRQAAEHKEEGGGAGAAGVDYIMREKEYRKIAFQMAGARYEELKPVLDRLNELEQEQKEAEERMAQKAAAKGGGGAGKSRSKKDRR